MKLFVYNFIIFYKLNKIILINTLLKRLNYRNKNTAINYLLLTLQQKLTKIKNLNEFVFKIVRNVYNTRKIKKIEKIIVYNININNVH